MTHSSGYAANAPPKSSSRYTATERRILTIGAVTAGTVGVGAALYYYIAQSESHIAGSYTRKNADVDRRQYTGRADTMAVLKLNKVGGTGMIPSE